MKTLGKIFKLMIALIFGLIIIFSMLGIVVIFVLNNTILNKDFILEKLEENNYYFNLYSNVSNTFEEYIGPSGLDESIFDDIISEEKIEEDTKILIDGIYEGKNIEISTDEIKEKLESNINKHLEEENLQVDDESSLEEFANKIIEVYEQEVTYSGYIDYIGEYNISNIKGKIDNLLILCVCAFGFSVIMLIIINIKKFDKILQYLLTFLLACAIILMLIVKFIQHRVAIDNIIIFSSAFSITIRSIINTIMYRFFRDGIIIAIVSLGLMIINNIIFSIYKNKQSKVEKEHK